MSRIFHVSDLHFGAEDPEALAWFAACVRKEQPDAVVVTGDITQMAKRSEFAAAADYLRDLAAPVTVEPGNHDLPYVNLFEPFSRPIGGSAGSRTW
ncbi:MULTISPECIES: metallophosphoesterase family protein [Pacificimonas]|uniref:Metallophosphoesterase n=1 Tax=Pacificimonas aurantium TaxID=1250540 RepID=A0ABS7WL99_9SPHN|nr:MULTISPECIES: metallophosphoesterase [Pacificimonas]MBZ6378452.1 metallophosphoesterase [Pacificimonas aurantium]